MKLPQMGYRQRMLALFLAVAVVPLIIACLIWYYLAGAEHPAYAAGGLGQLIAVVGLLAILPAAGLAALFSELVVRPIRRIEDTASDMAGRHHPATGDPAGIARALAAVSERLTRTVSEEQAETGLITAERNKLRSVLDSMTDGVFAVDNAGRIILFNKAAAELTGRSITDVAGQLAEKVLPFRQNGELVMTRWLAGNALANHQLGQWPNLELYRADGSKLYVSVQAVTLRHDPNGIRALITFHDLTQSRQLEKMQIDFVALAAHELRTPVTEMRGYLDLLLHEKTGLNQSGRELVQEGVVSARQLSRLINHLLGVAQIEHGELAVNPEVVDWQEFIADVTEKLAPMAGKRRIELAIPKQLPKLLLDPIGMREVLNNLLDNAIAHTDPAKGRITVTVRQIGSQLETSVADNGPGVPAEALPRLFTRFFRAEGMHSTRGTGLGLYISRAIVEAHGGSIVAQSPPGEGATFTFYLPITNLTAAKRSAAALRRGTHGWIKAHSVR